MVTQMRECLSKKPLLVIPRPRLLPSISNYLHFDHQILRYGFPRLRHNLPQEVSQLRRQSMTLLLLLYPPEFTVEVRDLILKAHDTDPYVKLKEQVIK